MIPVEFGWTPTSVRPACPAATNSAPGTTPRPRATCSPTTTATPRFSPAGRSGPARPLRRLYQLPAAADPAGCQRPLSRPQRLPQRHHRRPADIDGRQPDRRRPDLQGAVRLPAQGRQDRPGLRATHVNGRVARGQRLLNETGLGPVAVQDAEYAFEAYYGLQATDWLMARPNIQYIHLPGRHPPQRRRRGHRPEDLDRLLNAWRGQMSPASRSRPVLLISGLVYAVIGLVLAARARGSLSWAARSTTDRRAGDPGHRRAAGRRAGLHRSDLSQVLHIRVGRSDGSWGRMPRLEASQDKARTPSASGPAAARAGSRWRSGRGRR